MKNILTFNNLSPKESVPVTEKIKWKGYGEDLLFGFIYLSKKYDNFSFPIEKLSSGSEIMWKIVISYRCLDITKNKMKLIFPGKEFNYFRQIEKYILDFNNLKKNLTKKKLTKKNLIRIKKKISKKRTVKDKNKISNISNSNDLKKFVLIPIYLGSKDCNISKGHFNIMIFNLQTMTIERFEPYGSSLKQSEHKQFDSILEKTFNRYLGKKYGKIKVINPDLIMNKYSFQTIEENEIIKGISNHRLSDPGGFCGVWGIWFINMRLKFPEMNTKDFLNKAEDLIKKKYNFRKFIRNYSQFLIKERRKMLGGESISDIQEKELTKKIIKLIK